MNLSPAWKPFSMLSLVLTDPSCCLPAFAVINIGTHSGRGWWVDCTSDSITFYVPECPSMSPVVPDVRGGWSGGGGGGGGGTFVDNDE